MRVGAIPQSNSLHRSGQLVLWQLCACVLFPEIAANSIVILGRHLERLQGELTPQILAHIALALGERLDKLLVVGGIGENRHTRVVLGCCAQEGNASDIDLLNGVCEGASMLRDRVREGVEVAHDDGDGGDALSLEILLVGLNVPSKDAYRAIVSGELCE
jgi:hypothetical protein